MSDETPTNPAEQADIDSRIEQAVTIIEGAAQRGLVTKDNVRDVVTNVVTDLMADKPELARRFKPGAALDGALEGTPYDGLDVQDLAFLSGVMQSRLRTHPGGQQPDEQLVNALGALTRTATVGGRRIHNTVTAEFGEELTGEQVLPLWEGAYCESTVMDAFDTIRMTQKKLRIPVPSKLPTAYVTGEAEDCTGLSPASTQIGVKEVEIEPTKTMLTFCLSDELIEDGSIIPVLPFYTAQARRAIALAMDEAVIRGDATTDTTNINNDGEALPSPAEGQLPSYCAFDGLHHSFLKDNTANKIDLVHGEIATAPMTLNHILQLRSLMTDDAMKQAWGFCGDARDRFILTDYAVANFLLTLEQVLTVDKFGPNATLITGQLGALWGMPILTSPCLGLYSAGIFDAEDVNNNTGSTLSLVNRKGFINAVRRSLTMETERSPKKGILEVTFSWRQAFIRHHPNDVSKIEAIAGLVGIDPAITAS